MLSYVLMIGTLGLGVWVGSLVDSALGSRLLAWIAGISAALLALGLLAWTGYLPDLGNGFESL